MKSKCKFRSWGFLLIIYFLLVGSAEFVNAQSQAGAGLSPTLIEQGADPGEFIQTQIEVSNQSDLEKTFYLSVRDISGVRDNGTPIYATDGAEETGFELSGWLTLGQNEMTLSPGAKEKVSLAIAVPENVTPGSHFGGIFVSAEPPKLDTVGAGVGFEVANIVSIRISGDVVENAQIRTFATDKLFYGTTDVTFSARVENKGNVLVRPYGPLELYNMFGSKVETLTFNDSLGGVFPSTIRDFTEEWQEEGLAFGRYEARLSLVYGVEGASQSTITSSTYFWVLPISILKPAAVVLGVLLLASYIFVKLYIRNKVRSLSQGRRLLRGRNRGRSGTSVVLLVTVVMLTITAVFLLILLLLFA